MTTVKPIIKLPPRSKSCTTRSVYQDNNNSNSYDSTQQQQYIVSQNIYFEDNENRLSDYDIQRLFQEYNLYEYVSTFSRMLSIFLYTMT